MKAREGREAERSYAATAKAGPGPPGAILPEGLDSPPEEAWPCQHRDCRLLGL